MNHVEILDICAKKLVMMKTAVDFNFIWILLKGIAMHRALVELVFWMFLFTEIQLMLLLNQNNSNYSQNAKNKSFLVDFMNVCERGRAWVLNPKSQTVFNFFKDLFKVANLKRSACGELRINEIIQEAVTKILQIYVCTTFIVEI